MEPGITDEDKTFERVQALDRLFRDEDGALLAPELDAHDEDVVDLEVVRSGFFPAVDDLEEPEPEPEPEVPLADTKLPPESARLPEPAAPFVAPCEPGVATGRRSGAERLLFSLLAANSVLVAVLLLVPGLFEARPHPMAAPVAVAIPNEVVRDDPGRPPSRTEGGDPASLGIRFPDHDAYDAAQTWIGRGHYERARVALTRYLEAHPDLTAIQLQAAYSSLAYCAEQLEDTAGAEHYAALVRDVRLRAASAREILTEAAKATNAETRRALRARLLLRQGLAADAAASRVARDGRISIGESYRIEARRQEGRTR